MKGKLNWAWWLMPVIPATTGGWQFEASLGKSRTPKVEK
jgi:hypothetical protein